MTVRDYPTGDYEESHGILLILNILMNVSEGEVFDLGLISAMEGFTSKSPLDSVEEPFRFFSCLKSDDFRHSDDLSEIGGDCASWGTPEPVRGARAAGPEQVDERRIDKCATMEKKDLAPYFPSGFPGK
jgi:hypothetical protein